MARARSFSIRIDGFVKRSAWFSKNTGKSLAPEIIEFPRIIEMIRSFDQSTTGAAFRPGRRLVEYRLSQLNVAMIF